MDVWKASYQALVIQCYVNEYIWSVSPDELIKLKQIKSQIIAQSFSNKESLSINCYKFACFRPMYGEFDQEILADGFGGTLLEKLLICDAATESELVAFIPRHGGIEKSEADVMRQHYEKNPYPRWIKTGLHFKPKTLFEFTKARSLGVRKDSIPDTNRPRVLVAGCGTGQNSLTAAQRYLRCSVLAVDFSLKSLCYAQRKTNEYGFKNIEYLHADLLQLNSIGTFDVIECGGVLHHLEDPIEGFRVLSSILNEGGLFLIGLYSKAARRPVEEVKRLISKHQFNTDIDGLIKCRDYLIKLDDPNVHTLLGWSDFYSTSEFRDLVFNEREHCFELNQIAKILNDFSLEFLGFEGRDHFFKERFKERFPNESDSKDLGAWAQFEKENPSTFAGMYQFWAQKKHN